MAITSSESTTRVLPSAAWKPTTTDVARSLLLTRRTRRTGIWPLTSHVACSVRGALAPAAVAWAPAFADMVTPSTSISIPETDRREHTVMTSRLGYVRLKADPTAGPGL